MIYFCPTCNHQLSPPSRSGWKCTFLVRRFDRCLKYAVGRCENRSSCSYASDPANGLCEIHCKQKLDNSRYTIKVTWMAKPSM